MIHWLILAILDEFEDNQDMKDHGRSLCRTTWWNRKAALHVDFGQWMFDNIHQTWNSSLPHSYLYWHSHDLTKNVNKLLHTLENYRINTRAHTHTYTFSLPAANSLWSSDCLPNWDRFLCAVALASDQTTLSASWLKKSKHMHTHACR